MRYPAEKAEGGSKGFNTNFATTYTKIAKGNPTRRRK